MRKTLLKWLTLTLLMVYAGWVAVWAADTASRQKVQRVEVRVAGSSRGDSLVRRGVEEHLGAYGRPLAGVKVTEVDTQGLEQWLSRLSALENVQCILTADRTLRIDVEPMRPEIRVFDSHGSHYVNRYGKAVAATARFYTDVPVVRGEFNDRFPATSVMPLTRFVASDPFLSELVAMVEAKDADNLLLVPRLSGHVINFGDTTRLAEKRDALLAMYRQVLPYKGWETYDTISVRFRGQVVATRRDKKAAVHSNIYIEAVDPEEATLPQIGPQGTEPAAVAERKPAAAAERKPA